MAEKSTFIMLDRNILNWRWYKNPNTMRMFIHLLLKANVKDHKLYDYTIRRGQAVVSIESLAENLGITSSQVRTALGHLKKTGEITSESTNQFQIITIVNYSLYQSNLANNFAGNSQANRNEIIMIIMIIMIIINMSPLLKKTLFLTFWRMMKYE